MIHFNSGFGGTFEGPLRLFYRFRGSIWVPRVPWVPWAGWLPVPPRGPYIEVPSLGLQKGPFS